MAADKSFEGALQREIREELEIPLIVLDEFFTVEHEYPTKSVRLYFFNCTITEAEPGPLAVADLRWVLPAELETTRIARGVSASDFGQEVRGDE